MAKPKPLEVRFWAKVNKDGPVVREELGECWLWTGAKQPSGYGRFYFGPAGSSYRSSMAHRVSFFLTFGRWPAPDLFVMHDCDIAACVNPGHLTEGTPAENSRQCAFRYRNVAQARPERMPRGEGHGNAKLTASHVRAIRARSKRGASHAELACAFGMSRATIAQVVHRRTWKHVA